MILATRLPFISKFLHKGLQFLMNKSMQSLMRMDTLSGEATLSCSVLPRFSKRDLRKELFS